MCSLTPDHFRTPLSWKKKKREENQEKTKTNALHEINLKTSETKVNRIQVFITLIMCKICLKLQLLQRKENIRKHYRNFDLIKQVSCNGFNNRRYTRCCQLSCVCPDDMTSGWFQHFQHPKYLK